MRLLAPLSLPVLVLSLQVHAQSSCRPSVKSCDFYSSCLEQEFKCSYSGYPLSYGERYCEKFLESEGTFSVPGEEWKEATMWCLQTSLLRVLTWQDKEAKCDDLKVVAFESHPLCYTNNGAVSICELPLGDWKKIVTTVSPRDYFSRLSQKQIVTVLRTCVDSFSSFKSQDAYEKLEFLESLP